MKFRRIIAVSLALALMITMIPFAALAATGAERLSGDNRYQTAVEVSQAGWDKSDVVVLARGDDFADALAGVSLAHKLEAPILLTRTSELHAATKAEIARLDAKEVVILGGLSAVSQAVVNELEALELDVQRISGANRYATAAEVASEVAPNGVDTAVIAIGTDFPDALAAASYAAAAGYPILLTGQNTLHQATKAALQGLGVKNTIVVGGPSVITDAVLADLPEPVRVFGANRYATAVELAKHFQVDSKHFYVATGREFADAITGSVLAAKEGTGLILVDRTMRQEVAEFITGSKINALTILGGEGSISNAALAELEALLTTLSGYELDITGPSTITRDEATEFAVNLKGDDVGVQEFNATLSYAVEGGAGVLEYKAGDTWAELPLTGTFGPAEGFVITPDWDETTELRFTAADVATYTVTITLSQVDGKDITAATYEVKTAAGIAAENFSVTSQEAINYYGYSVGFRLIDGITPADLDAVEVSLFNGDALLVTNTAKEALFGLTDLQHTSPFNVYAEFENYTEEYWTLGQWQGELLDVPTKAVITVTLTDGREITVENTNLTGDVNTILPQVWNEEQAKAYATIQAAINAADPGDTIFVAPGTHTGRLNITKSINLVGADRETVIIDASAETVYGIYVKADDVTFSNFTFNAPTQEAAHTFGFKVEHSNDITITDVTVLASYRTGLDLNTVTGVTIENVAVEGTQWGVGIALTNSEDVVITDTKTAGNAWGGVAFFGTAKDIVIGDGNDFEVLYTQGTADFDLDLSASGIEYKLTDSARPEFTFFFSDSDLAVEAAVAATTTALSNLEGTEFYVVEGMGIQAAVDAAGKDALVFVDEGTYTEDVVISTDGLVLTGNGEALLTGSVKVAANEVVIDGLTFVREATGAMLQVTGSANDTTIVNNVFLGNYQPMAIVLDTGTPTNVLIQGNVFRFIHTAVYIHRGENIVISNNVFTDFIEGAVSIETYAKNVLIEDNSAFFSASSLVFLWSDFYSEDLTFEDEVTIGENELTFVNQLLIVK